MKYSRWLFNSGWSFCALIVAVIAIVVVFLADCGYQMLSIYYSVFLGESAYVRNLHKMCQSSSPIQ